MPVSHAVGQAGSYAGYRSFRDGDGASGIGQRAQMDNKVIIAGKSICCLVKNKI